MRHILITLILFVLVLPSTSRGAVSHFMFFEQWQEAVNHTYTTIDFTGWPQFTFITDQYEHLGVSFEDTDAYAWQNQVFSDGAGMQRTAFDGNIGIHLRFAEPQYIVGAHHVGDLQIKLYSKDELIYTSPIFPAPFIIFGGIVSDVPFDSAVIYRPSSDLVVIDNLYFGPPIPAPGALALLAVAVISHHQRRRRA